MTALLGLDIPMVEAICAEASGEDGQVHVANDNCPGQVVVSGADAALDRLTPLAEAAGARKVVRLAVSIAAHSYLMTHAQAGFNEAVANAGLRAPRIPVVGNVTGRPLNTVAELEQDLKAQLTSRVRWTESVQYMLAEGVDTFIEVGTGKVLTSLVKRIDRKSTRINLGEPQDFEGIG
jgi:[acyl-carrier-protein] S-malonyltransferase